MEKTEDKIQPIELTENWHIVPVAEDFETVTIIIFLMFKNIGERVLWKKRPCPGWGLDR